MTLPHLKRRLGRTIRTLRVDRGMSQLALAFASGMSPARVNEIENARCEARVSSLIRIADALGVEVTALFRA
jgi:transcriptional regulator with XRE-family HTH domain